MKDETASFEREAKRSGRKPPYHLIPIEAIQAIAERFQMGAERYGENNWRGGGPDFFKDAKNHLFEHMLRYIDGDTSEDNLGAVLWNASALTWWERAGKAAWDKRTKTQEIAA